MKPWTMKDVARVACRIARWRRVLRQARTQRRRALARRHLDFSRRLWARMTVKAT